MIVMILLTIILLSLIIICINCKNDLMLIDQSNDLNDKYSLDKGDNIDEFKIEERLEYLGLPSIYWFDIDEIINDKSIEVNDKSSKTIVSTTSNMLSIYNSKPLLPDSTLLLTTTTTTTTTSSITASLSASSGYITLLKQLRSFELNSTCIRNGTFCIDQLIFKGGHGDVYRANKLKDGNIDYNSSYILKRMYVKDRPAIERCALREIYFGELLRGKERVARFERYFKDEDNYWLVFKDEGVSLQSLLYAITIDRGFAVYEPSQFWIKLRTGTGDNNNHNNNNNNNNNNSNNINNNMMMSSIIRQILLGVIALHEKGIIHRDLKPGNILLNAENSKPKLIIADFSSAVSDIALQNNLYGENGPLIDEETLHYAPPEVLLSLSPGSEIAYDKLYFESYDTWSIGVIFLELILGTADVFSLDQRTSALINQRIRNDEKAKADALLLAALADYCILSQDFKEDDNNEDNIYDITLYNKINDHNIDKKTKKNKMNIYPLFKNSNGFNILKNKPRCGLEELRLAILKRDPLSIGFNDKWGLDLLKRLLAFKPSQRITLSSAVKHAYFVGPYISQIDLTEHATEDDMRFHEENIANYNTNSNYNHSSNSTTFSISKDIINEMEMIFSCSTCNRKFSDYQTCLKHVKTRKHGIKCHYDQSNLPPCLSEASFLPIDEMSGWCDLRGRRAYIEDKHVIVFQDDHKFFAVLDGHFGVDAAIYVGKHLYPLIFEYLDMCEKVNMTSWSNAVNQMVLNLDHNNKVEWKDSIKVTIDYNDNVFMNTKTNAPVNAATVICAIEKAFHQININFISGEKGLSSGTTVTTAILFNNHLVVAHVGDSRVVLCCNSFGMPIQLTADHTPLDSQEYERVYKNGGFVEVNGVPRVNGILAITRSIGDKSLRYVLSSTPDIIMLNLDKELSSSRSSTNNDVNNNDNNCIKYARLLNSTTNNKLFLILGSDGLYETVSNEDATEIVCQYLMNELIISRSSDDYLNYDNMHNAAKLLAQEAYVRGSTDNIGVCVTKL